MPPKYETKSSTKHIIGKVELQEIKRFESKTNLLPLVSQVLGRYPALQKESFGKGNNQKNKPINLLVTEIL
jgi:hypothetical protein